MTRTTKTTTKKPTYVTNTNTRGTKTGVSNNSKGTKTVVVTNKAGTTYTKVTNAAGKTFTKATDSKGNVIKPKVTAKVVAKVTPKVTATKPLANNKVKTATAVSTPNYTRGKSFLIENDKKYAEYGTKEQADSAVYARRQTNPTIQTFSPLGVRSKTSLITKQSKNLADSSYNPKTGKMRVIDKSKLPDYVAPKNTGAGKLLRYPEVKNATGWGNCEPGYKVDSKGNCVKK